jgi:hypothetical protein
MTKNISRFQIRNYTKTFDQAFTLDSSKIRRLLDVITQKINPLPFESNLSINCFLKDKNTLKFSNVDDLLNYDNTIKNPIENLAIEFSIKEKGSYFPKYINIDFCKNGIINFGIDDKDNSEITKLRSEIEEQIERTLNKNNTQKYLANPGFVWGSLFLSFFIFILLLSIDSTKNKQNKSIMDLYMGKSIDKFTEKEKIDFIFRDAVKKYIESERPFYEFSFQKFFLKMLEVINLQNILRILPFLIAILVFFYSLLYLYPKSNFFWGDMEEKIKKQEKLRENIFHGIFIALLIGFSVNLSSAQFFSDFFNRK